MAGRDKDITPDDRALWQAATQDVEQLHPARPEGVPIGDAFIKTKPTLPKRVVVRQPPPAAITTPAPQARDLDHRTQRRLERGEMAIDAVLDLHGHKQDEAFAALNTFVLRAYHAGLRCVLVITGKGRLGTGVLRSRFPDWIESPALRPVILRVVAAKGQHGGDGAFYILLRRERP